MLLIKAVVKALKGVLSKLLLAFSWLLLVLLIVLELTLTLLLLLLIIVVNRVIAQRVM